jgi:hypothetical protein
MLLKFVRSALYPHWYGRAMFVVAENGDDGTKVWTRLSGKRWEDGGDCPRAGRKWAVVVAIKSGSSLTDERR